MSFEHAASCLFRKIPQRGSAAEERGDVISAELVARAALALRETWCMFGQWEAAMRLMTILLAAAATTSVLSGCGRTQYYSAEEVRRLGDLRRAAEATPAARATRTARVNGPAVVTDTRPTVGVRPRENMQDRPWPAADSLEAQEIAAQQALRERRINEMVNSVCRGC